MAKRKLPPGVYTSGREHYQWRIQPKGIDPATGKRPKQIVRGGYRTPEDAYEARMREMARLGMGAAPELGKTTVDEYMRHFLDGHAISGVEPTTNEQYRGLYRNHIAGSSIADLALRDLTVPKVRAWLLDLTRNKSASTAKDARRLLNQALRQAMADGMIDKNPAALVKPPKHEPKDKIALSGEEIARFLTVADTDSATCAAWYLMLMLQMRPGEIVALRWEQINLDTGTITINAIRSRSGGKWVVKPGGKTTTSNRPIPMPETCVQKLREHRTRQLEYILRAPPGMYTDNGFVFPGPSGAMQASSTLGYRLQRLCEQAGLPRLTPHELRGSGATWMIELGVDPKTVSQRLGHSSVKMTLDKYVRPGKASQARASGMLDRELDRLRDSG